MKPENKSKRTLAVTQSKAKHYEYNIPEKYHIDTSSYNLYQLLYLTIGILGDISSKYFSNDEESVDSLLFSAQYFDSLVNAHTSDPLSNYYKLLGACAYYLNGLPGTTLVLIKGIDIDLIDLNVNLLDKVILALLKKKKITLPEDTTNVYYILIKEYIINLNLYYEYGNNKEQLIRCSTNLKDKVYEIGTDRELLFSDLICAISKRYTEVSLWATLPAFSSLDISLWESYIRQNSKIKELWPSQIKLGKENIFNGSSGIIQMPTSAGKTKSMELLVRSSIMGRNTSLVVLVAPFRALCQEIYISFKQEFGDMEDVKVSLSSEVIQDDLDFNVSFQVEKNILILTPEKLIFLIRNFPDIIDRIGLIIFDEGHLFDDASRGTRYEFLVASLKMKLLPTTQIILISAVIPNAKEISSWLLGDDSKFISVNNYTPTNRNIAFVSWSETLGRLYFRDISNIDNDRFWVPRVLEQRELTSKKREKIKKYFPEFQDDKYNSQDIALLLGCQLVDRGSVAIFTGRKGSVRSMIERIVDVFDRQVDCKNPVSQCSEDEIYKFRKYLCVIYGENSEYLKASQLGVFAHHGDVPRGVRLAIEFAIGKEFIKYVVCTSTLAQGVNMPIKNLIISSHIQGVDIIKTRDFHNLIGRVGRAGFYTEGTIIFSDHTIFDKRSYWQTKWRWDEVKKILDPTKAESCRSFIYYLFEEEPLEERDKEVWKKNMDTIKNAVKDYLLYTLSSSDEENINEEIEKIVKNTFAFHSFDNNQREILLNYFKKLANEILQEEPDFEKRKLFMKSMLPLSSSIRIYDFLKSKIDEINSTKDSDSLLELLWDIIYTESGLTQKIKSTEIAFSFCKDWVQGESFVMLYDLLKRRDVKIRGLNIDTTINLCESIIGYTSTLVLSACTEILRSVEFNLDSRVVEIAKLLQKSLQYGLSDNISIMIYEMGLNDRNLSMWISNLISGDITEFSREVDILKVLKNKDLEISEYIKNSYPSYFLYTFNIIIKT